MENLPRYLLKSEWTQSEIQTWINKQIEYKLFTLTYETVGHDTNGEPRNCYLAVMERVD